MVDDRKHRLTSVPLKQRTYILSRHEVLGTFGLHFLLMMRFNLCDDVNESDVTLFADDMTIGYSSANIENLYLSMNLILDIFKKWFKAIKLAVNILIKLNIFSSIEHINLFLIHSSVYIKITFHWKK